MGSLNAQQRAWLGELYETNFAPVFRTCAGVLGNPDDAADASQEVFLIAADSLQPGTNRATARAWLQTVARNHCLDVLRRRKRLGKVLAALGTDGEEGGDVAGAVVDRDLVDTIFKRLSPVERQVLWQSAVEQRAIVDIASRLRLSYMAAAQVIHRARRHALELAARVAIVIGAVKVSERVGRVSLTAARVAAVPMIAVSVISMQSSSGPTQAGGFHEPGVSVPAAHSTIGTRPGGESGSTPSLGLGQVPPALGAPSGAIPSDAAGAITSGVSTLNGAVARLGGIGLNPALPSPPAVVSPVPLPTPSIPTLPSPKP